jgi:hypothetical protein
MLSLTPPSGERATRFGSTATEHHISNATILPADKGSGAARSRIAAFVSWSMALRQQAPALPDQRRKFDSSPRLIAADAALTLVERWRTELGVLQRRSPTSDAVKTLADCLQELTAAITAGHDMTIQLTVAEAHVVSHIPVSTLRWLCNHKPATVGAHKREGIWYIDRSMFERYLLSQEGRDARDDDGEGESISTDNLIALAREPRAELEADLR